MQLLIVDDETIIVEDIKSSIEWSRLGITAVFTAFNIRQAKEVFSNNTIDIMLCDIEMPQGSGLELLSWVRESSPKTESIFLTCHADFRYAKEAIRLGSLDYILKPVPYSELEKTITKAINKISKNSRLLEYSRFGEFWFKHQPLIIERFWMDILNRTIPANPEAIKEAAASRNIPYMEEMKFIPILLSLRRWYTEWSLEDQKIMEYGIKNVAGEIILKDGTNGLIIELESGKFVVMLSLCNYQFFSVNNLKKECAACIEACHQYMGCDISCYVGDAAYAHQLPVMVDQLVEREKNNVSYDNKVFLFNDKDKETDSINLPDMSLWSVMLTEGSNEKLLSEVVSFLEDSANVKGLNADKLKQFHYDFMQMVYTTINKKGIQAHKLFSDTESVKLYEQAIYSVRNLVAWIKHVILKVGAYADEVDKSQTIVNKVKNFIKLNSDQDLTREEVAGRFYLNPDYLDRIFKKETGVSITKFMVQERLAKAKELLSGTELSISEIAVSIGYKNMSHFSTVFRKYTNTNPNDYRRNSVNKNYRNMA